METTEPTWPEAALEWVSQARTPVVLTGAGMSAESGIPTFRDALTGHWATFSPEELATPEAFADNPSRVWSWYANRREGVAATEPHAGHVALAELERYFDRLPIITQNVDGLHALAGSSEVIELHGNLMRTVCSITRLVIPGEWLEQHPGTPPPSPHHPDGLARPDVVWFGEALPEVALQKALADIGEADLCLAVGTSAMVQPAASLPLMASDNGARVIEINPSATPLSASAHACIRAPAGLALPALLSTLMGGVTKGSASPASPGRLAITPYDSGSGG